jgi:putative membrane protein
MIEALAGVATGLLAGLVPGVHANNLLPFVAFLGPYFFVPFSIAWLFSSAFPSILLGVPSESLAVLPGHRLVLAGRANEALMLCTVGALFSLVASVAMLPLLALFLPLFYEKLAFAVPYALFTIVAAMVLSEHGAKKLSAAVVVAISSILGFLTFSSDYLLPLLSGFFGLSTLLVSQKSSLPAQNAVEQKIPTQLVVRSSLLSSFLSPFFGLLPGASSGITAYAAGAFGRLSTREFLATASAANASYAVLSLFALSLIGKRSEERRVGKECRRLCRSRWSPYH